MLNIPPPPPDFEAMRDDVPVTVYQRFLPHWRQAGATYAVTFRLGDSLPAACLRELDARRREWAAGRLCADERDARVRRWINRELDAGHGECVLRPADACGDVLDCLRHFDAVRYHLFAAVVMPNHVHAILRPLTHPLEDLLNGIKAASAARILRLLGRRPPLWQRESFDRIVRDAEHLWRVVQYLARNVKAMSDDQRRLRLYVRPDWDTCGWGFRFEEPARTRA